jgi:tetratricopeptide (TPR) repeat protein
VLLLRVKHCERAIRNGRLDEAYSLVRQPELRSSRRGQELLDILVRKFLDRGGKHLAAGRLPEAAADADKAAQLAGRVEPVLRLQSAVEHALAQEQEANRRCGQALALARRHMERGELSVVGRMLEASPPPQDGRVDGLKRELHARQLEIESCQSKASAALSAGDWDAAIDHLSPLGPNSSQDGELRKLCGKISLHVAKRVRESLEIGRLDTATACLAKLQRLPAQTTEVRDISSLLEQCGQAQQAIESGRWRDAEETLCRLQTLMPAAKWVAQAAQQARQLGEGLSALRAGPLSLMACAPVAAAPRPQEIRDDFYLHVDGAGSFKVIARPSTTLGPISSSRPPDVPLAIDAAVPAITIIRSEDDYFLRAASAVTVNGSPATNRLLSSGDKIAIGSRCRITFRRPSPASATAVLDLSDAHPAAASLRNVVLMDREIVIGPTTADHIRAVDLAEPAILQRRGNAWTVRLANQTVDLVPNVPVQIGTLRLVATREQRP